MSKLIEVFLPDGDSRGIREATVTTDILKATEVPRTHLAQFESVLASTTVGIYFLFGQDSDGEIELYIGQTGTMSKRLKNHEQKKAFWTSAVLITSLTDRLTQTHAQYLEWKSISDARTIGRYTILNIKLPSEPSVSLSFKSECNDFYETMRILLSTLGHRVFEPVLHTPTIKEKNSTSTSQQVFFCKSPEANGQGIFTEEGFVVLSGSRGKLEPSPSLRGSDLEYRNRLFKDNVIEKGIDHIVFVKDHLVGSSSKAATVILGRSANGWIEWKTTEGKTADEVLRKLPPDEE